MRAVVGVTDNAWAGYLRDRPHITEANFWLPSPNGKFKALQTGEPFLFKTHHPENQLVGGGFFSGYNQLSIREAWEFIAHGNGVGSADELAEKIGRYLKVEPSLDLTRSSTPGLVTRSRSPSGWPTGQPARLSSGTWARSSSTDALPTAMG